VIAGISKRAGYHAFIRSSVATLSRGISSERNPNQQRSDEYRDSPVQDQAFAALAIPSCGYQRTGAGRSGVIAVSGVPSKSTISLVRYGFSLWHWGHRILKTWDFRGDNSASSAAACSFATMAGTGIAALQ
jgi:hypothetical protein